MRHSKKGGPQVEFLAQESFQICGDQILTMQKVGVAGMIQIGIGLFLERI